LSLVAFHGKLVARMQQVKLGIVGGGTVGSGVYDALRRNGDLMSSRLGVGLEIVRVAVRDLKKSRAAKIPGNLLTTDWREVVCDPEVNVVVELIGGTTTAREVILTALKLGKPVVTANKALLSKHGEELFSAAKTARGVCGQSHQRPVWDCQRHLQLHPHADEIGRRGF
jgi:homoserine dehydrogenase